MYFLSMSHTNTRICLNVQSSIIELLWPLGFGGLLSKKYLFITLLYSYFVKIRASYFTTLEWQKSQTRLWSGRLQTAAINCCVQQKNMRSERLEQSSCLDSFELTSFIICFHQKEPLRYIWHYQYLSWPDHGVPNEPGGVLWFLEEINRTQNSAKEVGPMVVHCR